MLERKCIQIGSLQLLQLLSQLLDDLLLFLQLTVHFDQVLLQLRNLLRHR